MSKAEKKALKQRIEGFGSHPMPPPISDTLEDRFHSAMQEDETFASWYNSARSSMDAVVNAFDDTVNAIADAVEDTVSAVVGDDDWQEPVQESNTRRRGGAEGGAPSPHQAKEKKKKKDNGERSTIDWKRAVPAICQEGDLDEFALMVRCKCLNEFEEREVGRYLGDHLAELTQPASIHRTLNVMDTLIEGGSNNARDEIREHFPELLEKLQGSAAYKSLAVKVLGRTAAEGGQKAAPSAAAEEEKKKTNTVEDLLDIREPPPVPAGAAASSQQQVDLLDMGSAPTAPAVLPLSPPAPPAAPAAPPSPVKAAVSPQAAAKADSAARKAANDHRKKAEEPKANEPQDLLFNLDEPKAVAAKIIPPPKASSGSTPMDDLLSLQTPAPVNADWLGSTPDWQASLAPSLPQPSASSPKASLDFDPNRGTANRNLQGNGKTQGFGAFQGFGGTAGSQSAAKFAQPSPAMPAPMSGQFSPTGLGTGMGVRGSSNVGNVGTIDAFSGLQGSGSALGAASGKKAGGTPIASNDTLNLGDAFELAKML